MEYAVYEDKFKNVHIKGVDFQRTFERSQVIYLEYANEKLAPLIDGLFEDYGELMGNILQAQLRKAQIRGVVNVDAHVLKTKEGTQQLQDYIDKLYSSFQNRQIAIAPQQKGFEYEEQGKSFQGQSVEEIDKVTDGFLSKVAMALGIPLSLIKGDMADVEKQTRNYMTFCIDPLIKKISDELNRQLFEKQEYLNGWKIDIRRTTYSNIFDVATAVDKLIASGAFNGDELRDELGYERTGEEIHKKYFVTRNYQQADEALKGGESE